MTITFPRALPAELIARLSTCSFDLVFMQEEAPTRGGDLIARDLGPNLWQCSYQTAMLTPVNYAIVEAWLDSLGGSINLFSGYDIKRTFASFYQPAGYGGLIRAGGGAFDGTASLTSVAGDNVTVTIGTLPAAFQISIGDYLGWSYNSGGSIALHRAVAAATADGSGNLSVEVRPQIRSGWAGSATVALGSVTGKFKIANGTVRKNLIPGFGGTIGFQGIQTLSS